MVTDMKKEKSRKSFWYFVIGREMIAFFIAAIIMLGATEALYYSFANAVKSTERTKINQLSESIRTYGNESEEDVARENVRLCFKCGAEDEMSGVESTVWIEDSNTGEVIADSDRRLFLFIRENEEDDLEMYSCDVDNVSEQWDAFDSNMYKTAHILRDFDDMDYIVGYNAVDYFISIDEEYYIYEVHDAYLKGHEFVPGVVDIYRDSIEDYNETNKEFVATIDMSPENKDEYEYIDEDYYSALRTHIFIAIGSDSKESKAGLRSQLSPVGFEGEESYYFTQSSDIIPGQVTMLCRRDTTDVLGRRLTVYKYTNRYFYEDCHGILQIMAFITGAVAFIIGLLVARKKYLENKYFCDMSDYRKSLMDSMAHDLRSPLTVMGGYAQNLVEDVNGEKRQYYADSIIKNVEYMDKIIADNLLLSRLSAEEIVKDRQKVDIVAKISELFEIYKPALQEHKVELVTEGEYIRKVNEASIKSALENIVSNAVKYVNPEGEIHVYAKGKNLIVSNTTDEKPEGKINDLWNPFVKGDRSRGNEKGTGLGLAIAKRVFELNRIKATLKYDEDTKTFMVIIG